jgi:hypothetical protein
LVLLIFEQVTLEVVGVALGGTQMAGSWMSAHCWVLRGHPAFGVCLLAPGLDRLTHPVVGVVVVVVGWGVVVC